MILVDIMRKSVFVLLSVVVFFGCSFYPPKKSTKLADYNKLVVRNINWNETAISDMTDEEKKQFVDSQTRLNKIFQDEFAIYVKEYDYFDMISYGNSNADSDAVILEPKIYTLKPTGHMPGASYTGILKSSDGRFIGRYTAERRDSGHNNTMDTIEELVEELAEDAASRLPWAR